MGATAPVRVVGVGIIRAGEHGRRVLAARRTAPAAAAGGWELPGGKCEAGEGLDDAAVREVAEELGCEVRVTGRLTGVEEIAPGLTLEVVTADLVAASPCRPSTTRCGGCVRTSSTRSAGCLPTYRSWPSCPGSCGS